MHNESMTSDTGGRKRGTIRTAEIDLAEARKAFFLMVGFIGLIWLLQVFNWADHYRLDQDYGILPRNIGRLPEIFYVAVPALQLGSHRGEFGAAVRLRPARRVPGRVPVPGVTLLVAITSGLAVWLFQSGNELTVGASGLIFGYFGYVLSRGLIDRNLIDALAAVVMALSYAYILTVAIPGTPGVSWIGHLGGLVGGIAAGWIFRSSARGLLGQGRSRGQGPGQRTLASARRHEWRCRSARTTRARTCIRS